MSFWSAVVLIVAIAAYVRLRIERHRASDRLPDASRAELEQELAELKRRIGVLEQIATDDHRRHALADEIESLRDR